LKGGSFIFSCASPPSLCLTGRLLPGDAACDGPTRRDLIERWRTSSGEKMAATP
jgi:hypothetical protein